MQNVSVGRRNSLGVHPLSGAKNSDSPQTGEWHWALVPSANAVDRMFKKNISCRLH